MDETWIYQHDPQSNKRLESDNYCNLLDQLKETNSRELLEHPPYSPDLAPRDLHLLSELKKFMRGKLFPSNEEVITAVKANFADLPNSQFRNGIHWLEEHWSKEWNPRIGESAIEVNFADLPNSHFRNWIHRLEDRWSKEWNSRMWGSAIEVNFADLPNSHFKNGIHGLEDRWSKEWNSRNGIHGCEDRLLK